MKNERTKLILKRDRKKRLEQGHPWIYRTEIEKYTNEIAPGEIVEIVNHQGAFLAIGYVNPKSQITARVLSYKQNELINTNFFQKRILRAKKYRERFLPHLTSYRAVYGEADFLPGLIVDKYEDYLVVQILAYGMEVLKPYILEALIAVYQPKGIYLRNDVPVRELEGLMQETGIWYGEVPQLVEIKENDLRIIVDLYEGQKTGYFFDQRDNRRAIKPLLQNYSDGAIVLDAFSHTGSFAINAAHFGAKRVTAVDISSLAIATAKKNAEINGLLDKITFVEANVFDYLRELEAKKELFDVVILDPPAFAKSKSALKGAYRGYKDINLRALKIIREGGYLVTASCSYHMLPANFQKMIQEAALDAHKILRLIHWSGAGLDHPHIFGVEEANYLKFAIFEVTSRS